MSRRHCEPAMSRRCSGPPADPLAWLVFLFLGAELLLLFFRQLAILTLFLELLELLALVDKGLDDVVAERASALDALHAAMASLPFRMRRKVSLSRFTRSTLSHCAPATWEHD